MLTVIAVTMFTIIKVFCQPFNNLVEKFIDDIHMSMFDAFVLLYYGWVPDNEKHLYKEDICLLYKKM